MSQLVHEVGADRLVLVYSGRHRMFNYPVLSELEVCMTIENMSSADQWAHFL